MGSPRRCARAGCVTSLLPYSASTARSRSLSRSRDLLLGASDAAVSAGGRGSVLLAASLPRRHKCPFRHPYRQSVVSCLGDSAEDAPASTASRAVCLGGIPFGLELVELLAAGSGSTCIVVGVPGAPECFDLVACHLSAFLSRWTHRTDCR